MISSTNTTLKNILQITGKPFLKKYMKKNTEIYFIEFIK